MYQLLVVICLYTEADFIIMIPGKKIIGILVLSQAKILFRYFPSYEDPVEGMGW